MLLTVNCMMTSSNRNIFRVTGPLCGEFTGHCEFPAQRPVTRSFDIFFDPHPNLRLSKQSGGWWLETQSRPLRCHCNVYDMVCICIQGNVYCSPHNRNHHYAGKAVMSPSHHASLIFITGIPISGRTVGVAIVCTEYIPLPEGEWLSSST